MLLIKGKEDFEKLVFILFRHEIIKGCFYKYIQNIYKENKLYLLGD